MKYVLIVVSAMMIGGCAAKKEVVNAEFEKGRLTGQTESRDVMIKHLTNWKEAYEELGAKYNDKSAELQTCQKLMEKCVNINEDGQLTDK